MPFCNGLGPRAENWREGAVLRGTSILGAESSTHAAQIDLNIRGMARLRVESLPPGQAKPSRLWLSGQSRGSALPSLPAPLPASAELGSPPAGCWTGSRVDSSIFSPLATLLPSWTWDSGSRQSGGQGAAVELGARGRGQTTGGCHLLSLGGKGTRRGRAHLAQYLEQSAVHAFAISLHFGICWWLARVCKAWGL